MPEPPGSYPRPRTGRRAAREPLSAGGSLKIGQESRPGRRERRASLHGGGPARACRRSHASQRRAGGRGVRVLIEGGLSWRVGELTAQPSGMDAAGLPIPGERFRRVGETAGAGSRAGQGAR